MTYEFYAVYRNRRVHDVCAVEEIFHVAVYKRRFRYRYRRIVNSEVYLHVFVERTTVNYYVFLIESYEVVVAVYERRVGHRYSLDCRRETRPAANRTVVDYDVATCVTVEVDTIGVTLNRAILERYSTRSIAATETVVTYYRTAFDEHVFCIYVTCITARVVHVNELNCRAICRYAKFTVERYKVVAFCVLFTYYGDCLRYAQALVIRTRQNGYFVACLRRRKSIRNRYVRFFTDLRLCRYVYAVSRYCEFYFFASRRHHRCRAEFTTRYGQFTDFTLERFNFTAGNRRHRNCAVATCRVDKTNFTTRDIDCARCRCYRRSACRLRPNCARRTINRTARNVQGCLAACTVRVLFHTVTDCRVRGSQFTAVYSRHYVTEPVCAVIDYVSHIRAAVMRKRTVVNRQYTATVVEDCRHCVPTTVGRCRQFNRTVTGNGHFAVNVEEFIVCSLAIRYGHRLAVHV